MINLCLQSRQARLAWTLIKLVLVPLILVYVILRGLKSAPDFPVGFGISHLIIAALIYQVSVLVNSSRLCVLLRPFNTDLHPLDSQRINLLGHLYYFVFMTGIAMEGLRYLRLRKHNADLTAPDTMIVIFLDRVTGAFAAFLMLVFGTLTLLSRHMEIAHPLIVIMGVLLVMLAGGCAGFLIPSVRSHMVRTYEILARSPGIVVLAVLQSVAANLLMVAGAWIVADQLQMNVDFRQILWAAMAGQVLMLIPISLFGIGAGEIGGIALLTAVGVSSTEAVVVISLIYFMRVSAALVGLAIALWEEGSAFLDRKIQ